MHFKNINNMKFNNQIFKIHTQKKKYMRSLENFSLNQFGKKFCLHNLILGGRISDFGKENLRKRILSKFEKKKKKKRVRPQIYKSVQKSLTLFLVQLFFPVLIYFSLSFKTVIERVKKLRFERSLNNHNHKQYHHKTYSIYPI